MWIWIGVMYLEVLMVFMVIWFFFNWVMMLFVLVIINVFLFWWGERWKFVFCYKLIICKLNKKILLFVDLGRVKWMVVYFLVLIRGMLCDNVLKEKFIFYKFYIFFSIIFNVVLLLVLVEIFWIFFLCLKIWGKKYKCLIIYCIFYFFRE